MLAAHLSGAQAGKFTDLAKASLKQNAMITKKALKDTANLAKLSARANAQIAKCALDRNCGR